MLSYHMVTAYLRRKRRNFMVNVCFISRKVDLNIAVVSYIIDYGSHKFLLL